MMSCNGCQVLRKGCSENCVLRQCLQWIDSPQSQANATLFVSRFFGRAALMSFLSSVPPNQRSSLFESLLFEAVGRTVNPVSGAVGLLWTGNWHQCQSAVGRVLRGRVTEFLLECHRGGALGFSSDFVSYSGSYTPTDVNSTGTPDVTKSKRQDDLPITDLSLCLKHQLGKTRKRRESPSDESETTTVESACSRNNKMSNVQGSRKIKLLKLFV